MSRHTGCRSTVAGVAVGFFSVIRKKYKRRGVRSRGAVSRDFTRYMIGGSLARFAPRIFSESAEQIGGGPRQRQVAIWRRVRSEISTFPCPHGPVAAATSDRTAIRPVAVNLHPPRACDREGGKTPSKSLGRVGPQSAAQSAPHSHSCVERAQASVLVHGQLAALCSAACEGFR